jgi:Short C-terminal domain
MALSDELRKLQELRDAGTLTDAEFVQAKAKLLTEPSDIGRLGDGLIGQAANRWVTFRIVMAIIGLIVMAIFFFGFFLPHMNSMPGGGFHP